MKTNCSDFEFSLITSFRIAELHFLLLLLLLDPSVDTSCMGTAKVKQVEEVRPSVSDKQVRPSVSSKQVRTSVSSKQVRTSVSSKQVRLSVSSKQVRPSVSGKQVRTSV